MILDLNTNLVIDSNYKIISLDKVGKLISLGASKFDNSNTKQSINLQLENGYFVNIDNPNDLENV